MNVINLSGNLIAWSSPNKYLIADLLILAVCGLELELQGVVCSRIKTMQTQLREGR